MPATASFDYSDWVTLLDKIRTKVRYIYMYDHACFAPVGDYRNWTPIV